MRWLIGAWLFCLMGYILTGCTISIGNGGGETTEAKQIKRNQELVTFCENRCNPFKVIAFIPVDSRCICDTEKK